MEQNEPSMEEILSSIRRILSSEEPSVAHSDEQMGADVSEDKPVTQNSVETEEDPDVMSLTPDMQVGVAVEPPHAQTAIPDDMILLSEAAVQASTDKLNRLVHGTTTQVPTPKRPLPAEGCLEELVAALLKPYLKEWLDANLPSLIEKIVHKEVARLTDKVHKF